MEEYHLAGEGKLLREYPDKTVESFRREVSEPADGTDIEITHTAIETQIHRELIWIEVYKDWWPIEVYFDNVTVHRRLPSSEKGIRGKKWVSTGKKLPPPMVFGIQRYAYRTRFSVDGSGIVTQPRQYISKKHTLGRRVEMKGADTTPESDNVSRALDVYIYMTVINLQRDSASYIDSSTHSERSPSPLPRWRKHFSRKVRLRNAAQRLRMLMGLQTL